MSLRSVRAGSTDPREVRKFLRRGVRVFSRSSLHAKFFLLDQVVIAGSSNISNHAKNSLDEAALLTDDGAAVRRAAAVFSALCIEPIRQHYLQKCIKEYRPPKFTGGAPVGGKRKKPSQGKLWIVSGLVYENLPEAEKRHANRAMKRASKKLRDFEQSEVEYSHYTKEMGFFRRLREDDHLVLCIRDGKGFDVYPPARFLGVEHHPRGRGKRRFLLLRETPVGAKTVRWAALRRALPKPVLALRRAKPLTAPLVNDADADIVMGLWDSRGKFRGRGRRRADSERKRSAPT